MENLGLEAFLVHLVTKDSEVLQEKQVPKETEGLKVLEEFLASLGLKETRACQVWMAMMGYLEYPGQRVIQGNLGLLVMQDCRGFLVCLEFLVQRVLLVKRVTQVLQGSLVNWGIQANRANRGHQERWDREDHGGFLAVEEKQDPKEPQAFQVNWVLLVALASLACPAPLDFLE